MHAAPRFGLAFGSLVFIRALLDRGSAGLAVTLIMFLFFAGISGVAYLGAAAVIRRRPLLTAAARSSPPPSPLSPCCFSSPSPRSSPPRSAS